MSFEIREGDTLQDVIDRVSNAVEAVRARAIEIGAKFPLPAPEEVRSLLAEITTDKGKRGIRRLSNPRKNASEGARCLFSCLGWHGSAGNLYGPMMWSFRIGADKWDRIDNLALVLRKGKSLALSNWDRAING